MVLFRGMRRWFSLGVTVPLLGLAGCLPSVSEIRDLAVNNLQDFTTSVVAIGIDNGFAALLGG